MLYGQEFRVGELLRAGMLDLATSDTASMIVNTICVLTYPLSDRPQLPPLDIKGIRIEMIKICCSALRMSFRAQIHGRYAQESRRYSTALYAP